MRISVVVHDDDGTAVQTLPLMDDVASSEVDRHVELLADVSSSASNLQVQLSQDRALLRTAERRMTKTCLRIVAQRARTVVPDASAVTVMHSPGSAPTIIGISSRDGVEHSVSMNDGPAGQALGTLAGLRAFQEGANTVDLPAN